jgi:hypothetical protein
MNQILLYYQRPAGSLLRTSHQGGFRDGRFWEGADGLGLARSLQHHLSLSPYLVDDMIRQTLSG